jgi:hypothetical protein
MSPTMGLPRAMFRLMRGSPRQCTQHMSVLRARIWARSSAIDDVSAAGGVGPILSLYDRLFETLARLGCNISLFKTETQVPVGRPSEELLTGAGNRGVEVVWGNVADAGGMIGCNEGDFEDFLLEELDFYEPLLKAIRDPTLPAALALYFSRACASEALKSDAEPTYPCYPGSHVCF